LSGQESPFSMHTDTFRNQISAPQGERTQFLCETGTIFTKRGQVDFLVVSRRGTSHRGKLAVSRAPSGREASSSCVLGILHPSCPSSLGAFGKWGHVGETTSGGGCSAENWLDSGIT